jgi:hypothetical protein
MCKSASQRFLRIIFGENSWRSPAKSYSGGKDLDEHDMLVKAAVGSLYHTDVMVTEVIMGIVRWFLYEIAISLHDSSGSPWSFSRIHKANVMQPFPCMESHEGAGTVVKVESSITEFEAGDMLYAV